MRLEWPHEHQGAKRMDDIQSFEDEAQAYNEIAAMGHIWRLTFRQKRTSCIGDFDSVVYVTASRNLARERRICHLSARRKIVANAGVYTAKKRPDTVPLSWQSRPGADATGECVAGIAQPAAHRMAFSSRRRYHGHILPACQLQVNNAAWSCSLIHPMRDDLRGGTNCHCRTCSL